jgi:hypothetical protein
MLRSVASVVVVCLLSVPTLFAQAPVRAVCDFDPNTQLAVEYQPISVNPSKPVSGTKSLTTRSGRPGASP